MKKLYLAALIAGAVALAWCGKKQEEEKETVKADTLILPMDLKCGDSACIK